MTRAAWQARWAADRREALHVAAATETRWPRIRAALDRLIETGASFEEGKAVLIEAWK